MHGSKTRLVSGMGRNTSCNQLGPTNALETPRGLTSVEWILLWRSSVASASPYFFTPSLQLTVYIDGATMRFSTRNAFYLRASNYRVIPLYLYLDERHVDWMSRDILDAVINKMQSKCVFPLAIACEKKLTSRIKELLTVERYEKKHKVYVERGGELNPRPGEANGRGIPVLLLPAQHDAD